jgi:hypothetical protein
MGLKNIDRLELPPTADMQYAEISLQKCSLFVWQLASSGVPPSIQEFTALIRWSVHLRQDKLMEVVTPQISLGGADTVMVMVNILCF